MVPGNVGSTDGLESDTFGGGASYRMKYTYMIQYITCTHQIHSDLMYSVPSYCQLTFAFTKLYIGKTEKIYSTFVEFNLWVWFIAICAHSLVPRPPRPTAKRWSGQMVQDSWAGYESYSGMSEYQSDFF